MDKNKMIPPKIWETDCKYCRFRDSEENFEYGTGKNKYDTPCKIGIFSGRSLRWNDNTKSFDLTDQEVYTEHELGDIVEVAIIEGMAITGYPRRLGTAEMQITDIITEHSLKNGTVSFIYELDGKKRMRLIPWNELTKRSEKH